MKAPLCYPGQAFMFRRFCLSSLIRCGRPRSAFLMSLLVLALAAGQSGAAVHPVELVWTLAGVQVGDHMGRRVAPAGDVNGDGFSDVIITATGR